MLNNLARLMAAIFFALALTLPASATTVGFDDIATTQTWTVPNAYGEVPNVYAGLNWTGWEVMNRPAFNAIYGQSEASLPSEPNFAYGGNDTATLTVTGTPLYFQGANFANWPGGTAGASSVTIQGYMGTNLVGTVAMTLSGAWSSSGGIASPVDRLEFSTNLGTGTSAGYFRMDNLQYSEVPEPTSLILMGAGLLGVGILRKRMRT